MKTKTFIIAIIALLFNISVAYSQTMKHTVRNGETVASIAAKYGVTVSALKKANPFVDRYFYSGMTLTIPKKAQTNTSERKPTVNKPSTPPKNNNDVNTEPRRNNTTPKEQKPEPPKTTVPTAPQTPSVEEGDEAWTDYMFWYEHKTFSVKMTCDIDDVMYSSFAFGVCHDGGDSAGSWGLGLKKRILLEDFLYVSGHVGPTLGLAYVSEFSEDKMETEMKTKFTYGLSAEVKAGIKIGDTWGITVGYYMGAPKFKFDRFFKDGSWAVGITTSI